MITSKSLFLLLLIMATSLNACLDYTRCITGNGKLGTEIRQTGSFTDLENTSSIDVIFRKGDTTSVNITADENVIEFIETEVYDNTLHIYTRNGYSCIDFNVRPLITVTTPNPGSVINTGSGNCISDVLAGINVLMKMTGSGSINADSIITGSLTVVLTGSANINIDECIADNTEIILTGSGNVKINGSSGDCKLTISGSGNAHNENLVVSTANIIITGSGTAFSNVRDNLTAVISGSGNIYLKGNPAITQTLTGSGRIIRY